MAKSLTLVLTLHYEFFLLHCHLYNISMMYDTKILNCKWNKLSDSKTDLVICSVTCANLM